MADTTEGRIAKTLMDRVTTLVLDPALPVAYPNMDFTPPANAPYLRVQHIRNGTIRQSINSDGAHRYLGILQVSVFWPQGAGEIAPREVAGEIIAHFPCDHVMIEDGVAVRVTERPSASDLIVEDATVQIAVSISYESFA